MEKLHPIALRTLHHEGLYSLPGDAPEQTAMQTQAPQKPQLLGAYQKNILILSNAPDAAYLPDTEFDFLTKILSSVNISMQDVYLMNTYGCPKDTADSLLATYSPKVVLLLQVDAAWLNLPMRFPHFQVQPWGATTFLSTPALSLINGSHPDQVTHKRKLWEALKRIFAV